ncbi:MAG: SBBP repeat-containing protein, partial [Chloroflexi bacterium]|nr:SBBP repeat-containing protein [Chloroflexota bacterium]
MKRANRVTSLALHLAIIFGLLTLPLLPGQANAASRSLSSYTVPRQANPSEGAAPAWVARYNGQGRSADFAKAIVVDAQGSVYVTGSTEGDRSTDAVTAKYDGAGKQLWLAQHAGSGSSPANAIALDAQDNVYITGSATVKYDKNGSQLWAANYPIMTWDDQAVTVATDSQGNVYVTGRSTNTSNSGDYATIKYDLNGNQLWVARYNGPDNGSDSPKALTLDAQGNVYVTGSSFANATGMDYAHSQRLC